MRTIVASFSLGLLASAAAAQCIDPAYGTPLAAPGTLFGDFQFPITPIGFAFPVNGVTYTDIHVCDKGYVWLSNAGVPAPGGVDISATAAELASQGPRICALWSDIQAMSSNNAMVYVKSTAADCTITWENVQCYSSTSGIFTMQMKLEPNGTITFRYGAGTTNASTLNTWWVGVTGVSPGGVTLPAPSDLSTVGSSVDPTVYEEWVNINTFDMAGSSFQLIPTNPGYVWTPTTGCASALAYGTGCLSQPDSAYEAWTSGFDLNTTTITWLRTTSGYVVLSSLPGAFVTPSATATNIAPATLDGEQLVTLSAAMPVAGGTTTTLNVTTKGQVKVSPVLSNNIDYTPTVAELLADTLTTFALWHDYDQTDLGSGLILFEEVGGIAYVTWNGVHSYSSSTPNTFQFQFEVATGNVTLVIGTMGGFANPDAGILGYSVAGPSNDPGATDFSALTGTVSVGDTQVVPLTLGTNGTPSIGNAGFALLVSNAPVLVPVGLQFFGTAVVNPGLDLTFLGMPGCSAYTNGDLGAFTFPMAGPTGSFAFPIPNNAGLIGVTLSTQTAMFSLATPFNLVSSNGVVLTLGT
ncbi:MAG: hypothetical protein JNK15_06550 [Planctomycetes bacterium]|nr:hypothetical protein [Planctomycetota bacterium]